MVCLCKKEFFPLARFREKAQTMMALLDDDIARMFHTKAIMACGKLYGYCVGLEW